MLKVVPARSGPGTATLILEGRLVGPWVEELRRSCEESLRAHDGLTLDLGAVTFVDRGGLALLRSLADRDVHLERCSPFVAEQIRTQEV